MARSWITFGAFLKIWASLHYLRISSPLPSAYCKCRPSICRSMIIIINNQSCSRGWPSMTQQLVLHNRYSRLTMPVICMWSGFKGLGGVSFVTEYCCRAWPASAARTWGLSIPSKAGPSSLCWSLPFGADSRAPWCRSFSGKRSRGRASTPGSTVPLLCTFLALPGPGLLLAAEAGLILWTDVEGCRGLSVLRPTSSTYHEFMVMTESVKSAGIITANSWRRP